MADATPFKPYETYGASLYLLTMQPCDPPVRVLPFGFAPLYVLEHRLPPNAEQDSLDPWMWWA